MASKPFKKNGHYYITWTDRTRTPRQVKEALKTQSSVDAAKRAKKLEADFFNNKHDPWRKKWYQKGSADIPALHKAVESYISYKSSLRGKAGWGKRTVKTNRSVLRGFSRFTGEGKAMELLTSDDFKAFYYRQSVNSDKTRQSYRRILVAFMGWCHGQGWSEKIDYPVDEPGEIIPVFLSSEEMEAVCAYKLSQVKKQSKYCRTADDSTAWMVDAWWLCARSGLRRGEILNIDIHNDIADGFILVGGSYTTKSNKQRKVPVMDRAVAIIEQYTDPDFRAGNKYLAQSRWLFGRNGESTQAKLNNSFVTCFRKVYPKKNKRTLHHLRDSFAVWYLTQPSSESMDYRMYKLQRILGHKDRETTEIYLKAIPYDLHI